MTDRLLGLKLMAAAPAFGAPCDVKQNLEAILHRVAEAREKGAELLLLPELCLTAQSSGDILSQPLLLEAAARAAMKIAETSVNLLCVFGLPVMSGGRLYTVMLAVKDGSFVGCWQKSLLTFLNRVQEASCESPVIFNIAGENVPVYEEQALPFPGREDILLALSMHGAEDSSKRAKLMADRGIHLALFPSAEPALAGNAKARYKALALASQAGCLCLYANAGANESSTDFAYDGLAMIAYEGKIIDAGLPFQHKKAFAAYPFVPTKIMFSEEAPIPDLAFPYAPPQGLQRTDWCRDALEIGAQALATRMRRIGAKTLTLGISGGLDSAMALLFVCRSFEIQGFDTAGIMAVSMPGPGSSAHTRNSARELVEALGFVYREINITPSVQLHLKEIGHGGQPDAAFENTQARERTQVLMDLANMNGGLMLGSGDMSELALGFTTYGGDHMSMYNPNAGLYKSVIRMIIDQAARDSKEDRLRDGLLTILATPISPELLPPKDGEIAQRTEEIVGPYELIDFYLYHFLLNRCTPLELLQLAQTAFGGKYTRESLLRYMHGFFRRFFASQFKRSCQTDGPQILSLSLSPRQGLRMPSDGSAALWLEEIDQLIETGEQV